MTTSSNPPAPPDPYKTSAAQAGANINSGIASTYLANPNMRTPEGSWTTTRTGSAKVGGKTVPRFTQTFRYTPAQQQLYNQNLAMGRNMNSIAGAQINRLGNSLSQPIDFSGAPALAGDSEAYRSQVEQGMLSRLAPQQMRDENALRSRLANQGVVEGSSAWNTEMDRLGQRTNDARIQAMLASGGEARAAGAFQNQNRQQFINEEMMKRNQPLNEISALRSGGQVAQPGAPNWAAYGVSAPDVSGNIYASNALANQQYNQQMAQQNAMWGGLSSAAGMLAGGFF